MADRKPFIGDLKVDNELRGLLDVAGKTPLTDDELSEQRISFAYGNAPASAKTITKDSVRKASKHILVNA